MKKSVNSIEVVKTGEGILRNFFIICFITLITFLSSAQNLETKCYCTTEKKEITIKSKVYQKLIEKEINKKYSIISKRKKRSMRDIPHV